MWRHEGVDVRSGEACRTLVPDEDMVIAMFCASSCAHIVAHFTVSNWWAPRFQLLNCCIYAPTRRKLHPMRSVVRRIPILSLPQSNITNTHTDSHDTPHAHRRHTRRGAYTDTRGDNPLCFMYDNFPPTATLSLPKQLCVLPLAVLDLR